MADKAKQNSKALNAELENALFSDVERWEMYFTTHWKTVVAVALAGVVVITAVFAIHSRTEKNARFAATQLSSATSTAELESAIAAHPQAPGANMARYRLAGSYLEKKEYDKALATIAPVTAGADAALGGKARMLEAYALELSGKTADAAHKFAALSKSEGVPVATRAEAACAAGRLLIDLGKKAEAKAILEDAEKLDIPAGSQSAGFWRDNAVETARSLN